MKKLISVIMTLTATLACLTAFKYAYAGADEGLTVSAKAAYLADFNSDTVVFAKNETEQLPIASMTKIMLLNLCFEKLDEGEFALTDDIPVSQTAGGMGGSQVFLEANKNYPASELIKSIIVASANDASVAMAERLYGSEDACVSAMNEKGKEWKLENTLFSNCTGLPKPTQYSCAKDVAIMLKKLISHNEYFKFSTIWTDEIDHGERKTEIANTNKLVRFYEGCDGGKTGFTQESGFCLAATAKRGNTRLISVVINAKTSKQRFADVSGALNYGFANYTSKTAVEKGRALDVTARVEKGVKTSVKVAAESDVFVFSAKNRKDDVMIDFCPLQGVKAPLKEGDKVGEIVVYKDNVEYARVAAVSIENVDKKLYFDYVKDVAKAWSL